jgi:hypothetical protein
MNDERSKHWYENVGVGGNQDAQALQCAYYNTFCNDADGKKVLCHLDIMFQSYIDDGRVPADGRLMAIRIRDDIFSYCGIVHDIKTIVALAGTARQFNIPDEQAKSESEIDYG